MRHSTCKECGATIEFGLTHANRKPIPIDLGTNPEGNLAVVFSMDDGTKVLRVVPKAELKADRLWPAEPRYMPHFATCPELNKMRHKLARVTSRFQVRRATV